MSVKRKLSIAALLAVAFVAGILFTTAGANLFDSQDSVATPSRAEGTTALSRTPTAPSPATFEETFVQVAESVNPTVVQIRAQRVVERQMRNPFEGTPFEDFFGGPRGGQQEYSAPALGSGVIIRSNGYIVTNNHVVQDAENLSVITSGNEEYSAEIVGTDPFSDLAVIKIEQTDLPSISFNDGENLRTGQWVLAFGSPLSADLDNTVTAGIISAVGRVSEDLTRINAAAELIQTDAAVNPGNSGGPLVNLNGELVGINSAIVSRSGGYQGISFAIPVQLVDNVTTQLIQNGEVQRGYLGVGFGQVSETLASALNVPRGSAQITSVQSDTPAEEAGLEAGEIIVAVDGQRLSNYNQLRTTVSSKRPGDTVRLTVVNQDGEERTVEVELATRTEDMLTQNNEPSSESEGEEQSLESLGISMQTVTPGILQRLGIQPSEEYRGVVITDISQGSTAYREADLRRGDIIVEVDKQPIESRQDFMDAYGDVESGESFLVRVTRVQGGQPMSFITALTKP